MIAYLEEIFAKLFSGIRTPQPIRIPVKDNKRPQDRQLRGRK